MIKFKKHHRPFPPEMQNINITAKVANLDKLGKKDNTRESKSIPDLRLRV